MRHTFHTRSLLRSTTLNLKQLVRPSTFAPQKPFTTDTFSVRCLVHQTIFTRACLTRLQIYTRNLLITPDAFCAPDGFHPTWSGTSHLTHRVKACWPRRQPVPTRPKPIWSSKIQSRKKPTNSCVIGVRWSKLSTFRCVERCRVALSPKYETVL